MTVWKTQNKRRPGAYINVVGKGNGTVNTDLGRTFLPISNQLNWGKKGVIKLTQDSDFKALLGHELDEPELQVLHEVFKGADTVLLLNNNDGQKATSSDAALPWKFTAQYPGTKGNDLHVSVEKSSDGKQVTVSTIFGTKIVDQQVINVDQPEQLVANDYIQVQLTTTPQPEVQDLTQEPETEPLVKTGGLLANLDHDVTADLTGGSSTPVAMTDLLNDALETEEYDVATTAGFAVDDAIHQQLVEEIKHLREDDGIKVRGVVPVTNTKINYEGISQVANGVVLGDGTQLPATVAAGYFAGASSSADAAKSLTYVEYPDAISAYPKLNNDKTIQALETGQIVFTTKRNDSVVIEQDINSLTAISDEKPQAFTKNRVVRTMDTIVTNTEQVFEQMFIGKVSNSGEGRDLFKANRVSYLQGLADSQVIDGFDAADISVEPGNEIDSILVNLAIKPLDSMEKLYMTMVVG